MPNKNKKPNKESGTDIFLIITDADDLVNKILNLNDDDFETCFSIPNINNLQFDNQNRTTLIKCLEKINARIVQLRDTIYKLNTQKNNQKPNSNESEPKEDSSSQNTTKYNATLANYIAVQSIIAKEIKPVNTVKRIVTGVTVGIVASALIFFTAPFSIPILVGCIVGTLILGAIGGTTAVLTNKKVESLKNETLKIHNNNMQPAVPGDIAPKATNKDNSQDNPSSGIFANFKPEGSALQNLSTFSHKDQPSNQPSIQGALGLNNFNKFSIT